MNGEINPNVSERLGSAIQALLYVNLILHKKNRIHEVAEKMNLSTDTLYRYAEGRLIFPAERLADLVIATGDAEYLNYIAEKAGYIVIQAAKVSGCQRAIRKIEVEIAIADGLLMDATERAMEDEAITKQEMAKILGKANEAIRAVETLKEAIKAKFNGGRME